MLRNPIKYLNRRSLLLKFYHNRQFSVFYKTMIYEIELYIHTHIKSFFFQNHDVYKFLSYLL